MTQILLVLHFSISRYHAKYSVYGSRYSTIMKEYNSQSIISKFVSLEDQIECYKLLSTNLAEATWITWAFF